MQRATKTESLLDQPINRASRALVRLVILATAAVLAVSASAENKSPCLGCHEKSIPAVYNEWGMSRHYSAGVGCEDCHETDLPAEQGSFVHHGKRISLIVSPLVCKSCHPAEYQEFSRSVHANAHECVSREPCDPESPGKPVISCSKMFIDYYAGDVAYHSKLPPYGLTSDAGALAAGINGCWQCHGSEVKIMADGKPSPATWPNAGIGRVNPDGSKGNCAACHERHIFSAADARRPEVCGNCHNEAGGDAQLEVYNLSRHGASYHRNTDKMNLESPKWIAGQDYSVAPTCSTCHISANPDMPVTHDVDQRILNRTATPSEDLFRKLEMARQMTCRCGSELCSHCKVTNPEWVHDYCQINKLPGGDPKQYMAGACNACHSDVLVDNHFQQYLQEVDLIMSKWVNPGRRLYNLAGTVLKAAEGDQYVRAVTPLTDAWSAICNHDAKYAMYGASMVSPGWTQQSNATIASDWYTNFLPKVSGIVNDHICSDKETVKTAAKMLREELCTVLSNPTYGAALRPGQDGKVLEDNNFCYNYVKKNPCCVKPDCCRDFAEGSGS